MAIYNFILGEKSIFVLTFLRYSHFGVYIFFPPLLVLILENASRFSHFRQYPNGLVLRGRRNY